MNIPLRRLACLSPQEIGVSLVIARSAAGVAVIITVASFFLSWRRGEFRWLWVCGVLLFLHPAWTMSVDSGDCGYAARFFSGAISVVFAAILLFQLFRVRLRMRSFLAILCGVAWSLYGASRVYLHIVDHTWLLERISKIFGTVTVEAFMLASPYYLRVAVVATAVSVLVYAPAFLPARTKAV